MSQEPLEMQEVKPAAKKAKFRLPGWTKFVLLVVILCTLAFVLTRCLRADTGHNADVAGVGRPGTQEVERVGFGTVEYNRRVDEYADRKTEEAKKTGETFIPPNTGARPVPRELPAVIETPPAPVEKESPQPEVRRTAPPPPPRKDDTQEQQRIMAYMQKVMAPVRQENHAVVVLNTPPARIIEASELTGSGKNSGGEGEVDASMPPGLMPGDILYAINRVSLDSDAPGPSMVEVIDGPYRGAKVMGSFKRQNKHLTLEFSSIIMPNGIRYQIQGYAIDPNTDRTAVRSSVDSHYLERFGGLIAASFLEGFGEAVGNSGTSSYSNAYGGGYSVPDYNINEQLWIAGGRVGERMAGVMERNFDIPPTVTLNSGTDIGVLLISVGNGRNETIGQGISSSQKKAEEGEARLYAPIQHQQSSPRHYGGRYW